jgi:anti-anti-sigma factor
MSTYELEVLESENGRVRVDLSGELDLTNARELELRLDEIAPPGSRLAVDMNRVLFIDSAALHVLFKLARDRGRDGLAIVIEPTAQIASTLALVGLERVASVGPSPENAPAES